jgi:hypothetical protein
MNPLHARLASLRRRWRFCITFRGVCWLAAVVLGTALVAGLLDWLVHLPGLVRALFLVGGLTAAGTVVWHWLVRPLRLPDDDLSLALRIEERYPELNDALASTVQFLASAGGAREGSASAGSAVLRRFVVKRTFFETEKINFHAVIDRRGLRAAGLSLVASSAIALAIVLAYPGAAWTALLRLAGPFGTMQWPPQTELAVAARTRLAQGEPFEIRGSLHGVIPETATVRFWFEGQAPTEQTWRIAPLPGEPNAGLLLARLEGERVRKNFRFQVVANDAVFGWQAVTVLPPPRLVPLDGRPSPQVRLYYPAYTDLPPLDLPDGTGNVEAVLGTEVRLRAAADRPVRAWIEYRPDDPQLRLSAALASLGAGQAADALALAAAGHVLWGRHPAQPRGDGRAFEARFLPWFNGVYALRFEDETGLGSTRLYDLRLVPDPAPLVTLERPAAGLDSLYLLPGAEITLQLTVEDPAYAIRSVFLEHRTGRDVPVVRLPLYDHDRFGTALPQLLAGLASPLPPPTPFVKLRPRRLQVARRLPLDRIRHADGSALKEGDMVILQACADDFDTVRPDKSPGRSHEVELRIVGLPALEAILHRAQAEVQQELVRLREIEREAIQKVAAADKQQRLTGQLRPEDIDQLIQAEHLQQQIRARVGTREEEGLRAAVHRVLQTLRDNHLPRSGAHERMELARDELDRLAREELEQIEPLLTNARKQSELARPDSRPAPGSKSSLAEALARQEEVEKTVDRLLEELERFSRLRDVAGQAKSLLQQQQQLNQQTNQLRAGNPLGGEPTPQQRAELARVGEQQARQAAHVDNLLAGMERLAEEAARQAEDKARLTEEKEAEARQKLGQAADRARLALDEPDPDRARRLEEEADTLKQEAARLQKEAEGLHEAARTLREEARAFREAAQLGRKADPAGRMKNAAGNIDANRLNQATQDQKAATQAMQEVVQALDDRREAELDRLAQRMRRAQQRLLELEEEQDRLRKKVEAAQQLNDPAERQQELQRLAREQERLRQEAQDLAQELTRLRAGRASDSLSRASGRMEGAAQQLSRNQGDNAAQEQDDALQRLQNARRELEQARQDVEEELARERLAKVADQIRHLRDRQQTQATESARIQRELLQKGDWTRGLLGGTLSDLARAQKVLAEDTSNLAEEKLKDARVFARLLHRAADAMQQAEERIQKRQKESFERWDRGMPLDVAAENAADLDIQKAQGEALRRLDQLLEALKPEKNVAFRPAQRQEGDGPMPPAGSSRPPADGIPPLAQLKLLRALQEEVNQRTADFARKHPDLSRLSPQEKSELQTIRRDQAEIGELLDELTAPPAPEGGKP